jgi:hypothetical protein
VIAFKNIAVYILKREMLLSRLKASTLKVTYSFADGLTFGGNCVLVLSFLHCVSVSNNSIETMDNVNFVRMVNVLVSSMIRGRRHLVAWGQGAAFSLLRIF